MDKRLEGVAKMGISPMPGPAPPASQEKIRQDGRRREGKKVRLSVEARSSRPLSLGLFLW